MNALEGIVVCAIMSRRRGSNGNVESSRASHNSLERWEPQDVNSTDAASTPANREGASRNLASISPLFIVKDLQASIAYYIERMGLQLDFRSPDDDVYYGQVSREGIGIFLKAILPDVLPRPNHTRYEWARWDAYLHPGPPTRSSTSSSSAVCRS